MAVEECEVCGAVVGDSAKHRRWHATHDAGRSPGSPAAEPVPGDAPAVTPGPGANPDTAVYPDTGPGNGLTPGLLAQGQALFTHLLGAGPTAPPGAADGGEPAPEGRPERPWRLR